MPIMKSCEAFVKEDLQKDVILVCGGENTEVPAVKALLVYISPIFCKLFKNDPALQNNKSGKHLIIIPKEYDSSSIETIVQFSLGKSFKVKPKNLLNTRAAALYYNIGSLTKALDFKILKRAKREENFCYFFHTAFQRNGLYKDCVSKFLDIFQRDLDHEKVFLSKYFLSLDFEPDLCTLFQNSKLKMNSNFLLRRLQDWASAKDVSPQLIELLSSFVTLSKTNGYNKSNSLRIPDFDDQPVHDVAASIPQFDDEPENDSNTEVNEFKDLDLSSTTRFDEMDSDSKSCAKKKETLFKYCSTAQFVPQFEGTDSESESCTQMSRTPPTKCHSTSQIVSAPKFDDEEIFSEISIQTENPLIFGELERGSMRREAQKDASLLLFKTHEEGSKSEGDNCQEDQEQSLVISPKPGALCIK